MMNEIKKVGIAWIVYKNTTRNYNEIDKILEDENIQLSVKFKFLYNNIEVNFYLRTVFRIRTKYSEIITNNE